MGFWIGGLYNATFQTPFKYGTYAVNNCRVCSPTIAGPVCANVDGYKGYVVLHYVTWTKCQPTTYEWAINGNGCWATIQDALNEIQLEYNVVYPLTWVESLPGTVWYHTTVMISLAILLITIIIMIVHLFLRRWWFSQRGHVEIVPSAPPASTNDLYV